MQALLLLTTLLAVVEGHGRWKCPPPRDALDNDGNHIRFDNTGNKYAACGPQSNNWGFGKVTKLEPGWTTFTWEESISHSASPFRLAILDETETAKIVLLDHIPHNDDSSPVANVERTYTEYSVSAFIPNVKCTKCSLQFLYIMTDKTVKCGEDICYYNPDDAACKGNTDPTAETCAGAPNDNPCVQENECFSNYHSCSDVIINGEIPISDFEFDQQPANWPYKSMKMNYYGAESGIWKDGFLTDVPSNFTTVFDSLTC